jgi:UDP-2,3-diacylglucosamine hydrolase
MAKRPFGLPPINLSKGKKAYFASDFHLGSPDRQVSQERERKIIRWLDQISDNAGAIFLVGDLFDFWFEYKYAIPKGFVRFQGKLAELRDQNIPIYFFTGNHDLWMSDYFPSELDIPIFKKPFTFEVNKHKIFIGHGDGLGEGDNIYKLLKKLFSNRFLQWLFYWIHPNIGMGLAHFWSRRSRVTSEHNEDVFRGEDEPLLKFCKQIEKKKHHDFYIFGHRHLPLTLEVAENSTYFNLGDWVNHFTYLEVDENSAHIRVFDN